VSRIALITNRESGAASEHDVDELLTRSGAELRTFAIERASEAADAEVERIVVAGGDGSIAPAAEAAVRAGVELAVIATGTANDFADRMGLPASIERAASLAADGTRTRAVDLARIGDRPFVNVASLGLPPAAADAATELKSTLGALAYTVGALQAASAEDPLDCRVACDGEPLFAGEAWQVTVGCTGAFGGGSRIDADADDGRLDVVVIAGGPRTALAKRALGLRAGGIEKQRGVRSGRCTTVEIGLDGEHDLNIDGEVVRSDEIGGDELVCSVEPRALRLVIG
jgi:diacylglycerol kinase (ATP)